MVKNVLVLECVPRYNWYKIFKDAQLVSGEEVSVEQATWAEVSITSYHDSGCIVSLAAAKNPLAGTPQSKSRTIQPDFVLFRTLCQHIDHLTHKNLLYAFKFAGVPAMNSLDAIYGMLEKPWVYGELHAIQTQWAKRGKEFPLIPCTYYPKHRSMVISPDMPCVVKIGAFHAGYGKIKVESQHRWDDVRSIVALHGDYCTAEEFIEYDYEIRIQKIGGLLRAFKRVSMNWKGNVGNSSSNEDAEVTEEFREYIDAASSIFGGMEICALDLVHNTKTDKMLILELNGTAIGLVKRHETEDMEAMRDLVIAKLSRIHASDSGAAVVSSALCDEELKEAEELVESKTGGDLKKDYLQSVATLGKVQRELAAAKRELEENTNNNESGNCCLIM